MSDAARRSPIQAAWSAWLAEHHAASDGVWIKFAKKASGIPTVVYAEAVEEALSHGWIDGQVKRIDDDFYMQRFTPRRARSRWSKINRAKAEALIDAGEMQPAGLAEVERAKADGRWERAYDSPTTATVPGRPARRARRRPGRREVLRRARRQQPLRDPAPHPGRQAPGDARAAGSPSSSRCAAAARRFTRRAALGGLGASAPAIALSSSVADAEGGGQLARPAAAPPGPRTRRSTRGRAA